LIKKEKKQLNSYNRAANNIKYNKLLKKSRNFFSSKLIIICF